MGKFITKILKNRITISLISIVLLSLVLIFLSSKYLKITTNHGQKLFTPSFKGLTIDEAKALAEEKEIKIQIIDSIYGGYGTPGTIIEQTPKSNFMIKKGRNIFLVVKSKGTKIVKMPDLAAQSLIQARSLLETAGLSVGKIEFRPSPNQPHLVLDQQYNGKHIRARTEIAAGSPIDLVVGEEVGAFAIVPDFNNATLRKARFIAAENYLNIGDVNYDNSIISVKDSVEAVVYKQSMEAGLKTDYGQKINLWFTVKEIEN